MNEKVEIKCSECGVTLRIDKEFLGQKKLCPRCKKSIILGSVENPYVEEKFAPSDKFAASDAKQAANSAGMISEDLKREFVSNKFLEPPEKILGGYAGRALTRESYGFFAKSKGGMLRHYLVITDQRVIFWARGIISKSIDAFYFNDISSVESSTGLIFGEIVINVRGAKERFCDMLNPHVNVAAELIRQKIGENRNGTRPSEKSVSIVDQIKQLAALRDDGILSEVEFQRKKTELLSRL